jgi:hypothetical protein
MNVCAVVEGRWLLDADLARHRAHRVVEAVDRLLGLEHVEYEEAVVGLCGNVDEEPVEGQVGGRLQPALAVGEPANDLLIPLPSKAGHLVDCHDRRHPATSFEQGRP